MNEQPQILNLQELLEKFKSEAIETQSGDGHDILLTGRIKLPVLLDMLEALKSLKYKGKFAPHGAASFKLEIDRISVVEGDQPVGLYVTHKMEFGKVFSDYLEREVEFKIRRTLPADAEA